MVILCLQLNLGVRPTPTAMSLFKRKTWRIEDVPALALGDQNVVIDIGFLGGEEHRRAFAALFQKLFRDNTQLFRGAHVSEIRAKRPVVFPRFSPPFRPDGEILEDLALTLYDSRNEKVELIGQSDKGSFLLGIAFDNPTFWLISPAV